MKRPQPNRIHIKCTAKANPVQLEKKTVSIERKLNDRNRTFHTMSRRARALHVNSVSFIMIGIKSYQRLIVGIFTGIRKIAMVVVVVAVVGVRLHRQFTLLAEEPIKLIERSNSIDKAIEAHMHGTRHNQIINVIKL